MARHAFMRRTGAGLTLLAALAPAACRTGESEPLPPSFHAIISATDTDMMKSRNSPDGTSWGEVHSLTEDLHRVRADITVSPDGVMRYIAFRRIAPDGTTTLHVRMGLGTAVWAEDDYSVVTGTADPVDWPPGTGRLAHIQYLRDGVYGISWIEEDRIRAATFDSRAPVSSNIALAAPIPVSASVEPRNSRIVYHDGQVLLLWSRRAGGARVASLARAPMTSGPLSFGPPATVEIPHTSWSTVISDQGMLKVVVTEQGESGQQYALKVSTDGMQWETAETCTGGSATINVPLLFREGDRLRALVRTSSFPDFHHLLDFPGCARTDFFVPFGTMGIEYSPFQAD